MNIKIFRLGLRVLLPGVTAASVASLALMGCGDETGGPGTSSGCAKVGQAVVLPFARDFDLAAVDGGFEVVLREEDGTASYRVDAVTDALGARMPLSLARGGDVRVERLGEGLVAASVFGGVSEGIAVATQTEGVWTVARSTEAAQGRTFTYGSSVAVAQDGEVVVVWIGQTNSESVLLFANWTAADGFGAYDLIPFGGSLWELGVEVHAAFDPAGQLRVVVSGSDDEGEPGLYTLTRGLDGKWSTAKRLGGLEGSTQGQNITALATGAAGTRAFAVQPASFQYGTDGGISAWDLDSAALTRLAGPADPRPVVSGVDAAYLLDGRALVSASWGANNLNPAQSDDAVLVYACDAGLCRAALEIDGRNGTFFGPSRIAIRGQEGAVLYNAQTKGGAGLEETRLQRFRCVLPSE